MADTIQPIHDELDEVLDMIKLDIEIMGAFAERKLDRMVRDFDYEQAVRRVIWEWEQDLIYG